MTYTAPTPVYAQETALEAPVAPIEAPEETIEGKISRISLEEGVSSTTVYNALSSESNLDPAVRGDHGCSLGLAQINLCARPTVATSSALDPDFAIRYFAQALAKGKEDAWSVCNCYSYVKGNYISNLPKMADIVPNDAPRVGGLIILNYHGVKHIAYITKVDEDGVNVREANYTKCLTGSRKILFTDVHLQGFWSQAMAVEA